MRSIDYPTHRADRWTFIALMTAALAVRGVLRWRPTVVGMLQTLLFLEAFVVGYGLGGWVAR